MFKPNDLATIKTDLDSEGGKVRRVVEVISRPIPGNPETIMVRMVPGEPTTLKELPISELIAHPKKRWLQVARVWCRFGFPTDMLRYDHCAIFDHELQSHMERVPDEERAPQGVETILVYRVVSTKSYQWTTGRWTSFSARITPVYIRDLNNPDPLSPTAVKKF